MVAITICNLQVLLVDLIGLAQVGKVTGTLTQTAMVDVTCTKLVITSGSCAKCASYPSAECS